jgi:hypothetical protein
VLQHHVKVQLAPGGNEDLHLRGDVVQVPHPQRLPPRAHAQAVGARAVGHGEHVLPAVVGLHHGQGHGKARGLALHVPMDHAARRVLHGHGGGDQGNGKSGQHRVRLR